MGIKTGAGSGWGDAAQQKQQYALLREPDALRELFLQPPAALQTWLGQSLGDGRALRESGLRFWLSAFHLNDPIGALRYTWAHGLLLANALQSALREPLIDLAVLHNTADLYHAAFFSSLQPFAQLLLDDADGIDGTLLRSSARPGERTALGQVFALFLAASSGASSAQPLALEPHSDPLAWGWVFYGSSGRPRSVLLGNLSEAGVSVDLSAVWTAAGGIMEGQVCRAAPGEFITRASSQPGVPFALEVSIADTQASGLYLPPYSLALLSGLPMQNPVYLPMIQKYN